VLIFASAIISLVCYRTSARNPYGRYFEEVIDQINARYVKDVDQQSLFDAAVRGMMSELDENSAFIGRTDAPEFQQALDGEFGGIGIEVSRRMIPNQFWCSAPLSALPPTLPACFLVIKSWR
jgi:carboxyl-terminal processing protease